MGIVACQLISSDKTPIWRADFRATDQPGRMCFEYLRAGSPLLDTSFIRTHKLDNLESIRHLLVAQPRECGMDDLLTANSRGALINFRIGQL